MYIIVCFVGVIDCSFYNINNNITNRTPLSIQPRSRLARSPNRDSDQQSDQSELGVGLNELEGAILLDAEDYRRMVQEVKTLKTMLLRLKRELTADVSIIIYVQNIVMVTNMAAIRLCFYKLTLYTQTIIYGP